MRGILVDPFKREVRDVEADFGGHYTIIGQFLAQGELGPNRATLTMGPRLPYGDIHSYMDDEGAFRTDQAWSRLKGYDCPLAGYILFLDGDGMGGEQSLPAHITAKNLALLFDWISPEEARATFPDITISDMDGNVLERIPVQF